MYLFFVPLIVSQCGPSGCALPRGPSWWQPPAIVRSTQQPVWQPPTIVRSAQQPAWQSPSIVRTAQQSAVLHIETVPAGGQVWLDGHAMPTVNGVTLAQTPPLDPGQTYWYRVTVRWGDVVREWKVSFLPGQTTRVVLRRDDPMPTTPERAAGTSGALAASSASTKPAQSQSQPPARSSASTSGAAAGDAPSKGSSAASALKPDGVPSVLEQDGVQNFGIDRSGLNGEAERITLNGRQITQAEAAHALQASSLADDSGKLRLTVIGTDSDRRRVLEDLKGPLSDIAAQCLVQDYSPDHWAVAKAGFYTAGRPTIYVQTSDGAVLHRQDDYADGAAGLRRALERLRRPDPDYRPDRDRDLRRSSGDLLAWLWKLVTSPFRVLLSWLLAAGLVYLLIVLTLKGWPIYFLTMVANMIPPPPQSAQKSTQQSTTRRRRSSTTRSQAKE